MSAVGHLWTEADMAALEREWRDGKTVQEIATVMRRTTDAVYAKIKRLPYTARLAHVRGGRPEMIKRRVEMQIGKPWRPDENFMRDDEYVSKCMAEGGFIAFSERPGVRGPVPCLPMIRPKVAA